jgi:hypothetical protein
MTSYASATAAWTPEQLEGRPDPSLLTTKTSTTTTSDSGIHQTKDALEYTPPLTPPITTTDRDELINSNKEEEEEEIPGSKFDHVIPGVKVMETRQLPDDLEKKIAKPCKFLSVSLSRSLSLSFLSPTHILFLPLFRSIENGSDFPSRTKYRYGTSQHCGIS